MHRLAQLLEDELRTIDHVQVLHGESCDYQAHHPGIHAKRKRRAHCQDSCVGPYTMRLARHWSPHPKCAASANHWFGLEIVFVRGRIHTRVCTFY